ncbi:MAG: hypothetical protein M0R80_02270 [Proteobacteria bacterium]|jgi:hypothetical protein|nr:hypothetical protein [Pseudomonadota bacterium]
MTKKDKLQHLLITYLLKEGQVEFTLPSGVKLEVGITKENKHGIQKTDDYCYVVASQDDRVMSMDDYNMELQFGRNRVFFDDENADNHIFAVV